MINVDIITLIALGMLVVAAIVVVFSEKLINAVIFMGAFSTITAFVFLLLGAPDVALAEIIIGSTLSTIIYLIAIKKFRLFTVYKITGNNSDNEDSMHILLDEIEDYLKTKEMQLHLIETSDSLEKLSLSEDHSLIIEPNDDCIIVHSESSSLHTDNIKEIIDNTECEMPIKLNSDIYGVESPYMEDDV